MPTFPSRLIDFTLAAAFGIAVVFAGGIAIPIVLYHTLGCAPNYCALVDPRLQIIPFIIGVLITATAWHRMRAVSGPSVLAGVGLGFLGILLGGAFEVAALPQVDPYFTLPYRLYALAFLASVSFVVSAVVTRGLARSTATGGRAFWVMPLGAVLLVAGASAFGESRSAALTALVGGAVGVIVGTRIDRTTIRGMLDRISPTRVLMALIVISVVSRAFFGLQTLARTGPGMPFAIASDDGDSYFTLASRLASDPSSLVDILAGIAFPPAYTIFLATLLGLTGGSLVVIVLAQAALAGIATWLVYQVGRRVAPSAVALGASGLFALDMNLIQNSSTLTAEALLIPVILAAIVCLARYGETRREAWLVGGAAFLGLCFVTRNVAALPLCMAVLGWLAIRQRREPLRVMRDAAIVVIAVVAFSTPIAFATAAKDGAPRFTTQLVNVAWNFEGGPGYTIGNGELIERGIDPFADPLGSAVRVLSDPLPVIGFYLSAAPQRLSTLLFFANPGFSDPLIITNDAYYPNAFGETVRILRFIGLLVGVGFVIASRHWRRAPLTGLLAAFFILYVAVFVFLFPPYHAFRYRIPVEPIRFIVEAGGVALMVRVISAAWVSRAGQTSGADREPQNAPA